MNEIRKQIGEKFTVIVDFTPKLPINGALASGVLLATRKGKTLTTTLSAAAQPGNTTLTLLDDVQNGASLVLNIGQIDEEPLLVVSRTGNGPYVATLASAVQLAHTIGSLVKYDQGASDLVLASTVAAIAGPMAKANIVGGLVYHYTLTYLMTVLTTGEMLREDVALILHD